MPAQPPPAPLDMEKLRAAIRKHPPEYHLYLLDDALELLTPEQLERLVGKYLQLDPLRRNEAAGAPAGLLGQVQAFAQAALSGQYYEDFRVDSRNCTAQSTGTSAFISDFHRLLDRCVAAATEGEPGPVLRSFDTLFGLLDEIDKWEKEIVFFADEGGAWQVHVDWPRVLPPWFALLSKTATAEEYAARVGWMLERHCNSTEAPGLLGQARQAATAAQREALAGRTR